MPRPGEFIDLEKSPSATHRDRPGDAAADDGARWVVLIGEGSDAEQTLSFLRELWPDVDCEDMARDTAAPCAALQTAP